MPAKITDIDLLERVSRFLMEDGTYDVPKMRAEDNSAYQMMRLRKLMGKVKPGPRNPHGRNGRPRGEAGEQKKRKPTKDITDEIKAPTDEKNGKGIYPSVPLGDGWFKCPRCGDEFHHVIKGSGRAQAVCSSCKKSIARYYARGWPTNKGNVRDEFCWSKLEWHGRVFEIGLNVSDRDRQFISAIGYEFMFKDEYPD